MNCSSIAICALARNCAQRAGANLERLDRLAAHFAVHRMVVVENNSTDGTKDILRAWAKRKGTDAVLLSNDYDLSGLRGAGSRSAERIGRMATYRNHYIEELARWQADGFSTEFTLMVDLDVEAFDVEGILEALSEAPADFGALFANGNRYLCAKKAPFFYDLYAYRAIAPSATPLPLARMRTDGRRLQRALQHEKFVPCASAFGGIGLYRTKAIAGNCYTLEPNPEQSGEVLCEHIPFNLQVRGQCYVARSMRLDYGKRTWRGFLWQTCAPDAWFNRKPKFI